MEFQQGRLVTIIHALSQVRTQDEIMKIVHAAAREFTDADGATFILKENGVSQGTDDDAIEITISGWAINQKKAVAISDIEQDSRIPIDLYRPTFMKSLLAVPIQQDNPIGAIGTYWTDHHIATSEEIALLQALANAAGVALENVKLLQSLNRQIEELSEANKAKDQFLMMVSHELRTPLNAIEGWAGLLNSKGLSEEEIEQGLRTILRNAKAQNRIINDLMDTSTIILNRISFEKKAVDVISLLDHALNTSRFNAMKKNLRMHFDSQFENAWVIGDSERLLQVFNNLLANAIKFTPEGGYVRVSVTPEGASICISIQDNGEGIPADFLPFVFERFRQADASLTRKHGGLGLGLAIARHVVQALNGTIEAQSAGPGNGSTFTMKFPLESPPLIETVQTLPWAEQQPPTEVQASS
jgi:signal transduction histidine kinase